MPQQSPGGLRSPRKRALEVGTEPAGFTDNFAGGYDPAAGVPTSHPGHGGTYKDEVVGVPDPGPAQQSPFKLGS